jgi:hypothetical protein
MDAVLCLREATHFQSMELERPEAICGLESGSRPRLWSTRRDCVCRQEVAFIGLRLAGSKAWIGLSVFARVGATNLSPRGIPGVRMLSVLKLTLE